MDLAKIIFLLDYSLRLQGINLHQVIGL